MVLLAHVDADGAVAGARERHGELVFADVSAVVVLNGRFEHVIAHLSSDDRVVLVAGVK